MESKLEEFFRSASIEGLISAYLFGSHSRGTSHRESGVDVGVLVERRSYPLPADRGRLRVTLGAELVGVLTRNDVDVVVLNDAPPELGRHVVTAGRRVFCSDTEADHAFVRDIQLRAADLAPFLARMRRIKLAVLRR